MKFHSTPYGGVVLLATWAFAGVAFSAQAKPYRAPTSLPPSQSSTPNLGTTPRPAAGSQVLHSQGLMESASPPRTTVVLRFAVQSEAQANLSGLSSNACPRSDGIDRTDDVMREQRPLTVDPKLLDKIATVMQEKLSKTTTATLNTEPEDIPLGASVISGCITRAKAGNSAKRLVGLNYGASHLEAHIVVLSKARSGWLTEDSFDIRVKGGDLLPALGPIGLAAHAVEDTQQTLSADAKKMANRVLKRMAKDAKRAKQTRDAARFD